jgi:dipeptidase E
MGKIIAIGGGETKDLETLPIEKEIIRLSGKKHPRVLYIPTAGGDDKEYFGIFKRIYGEILSCTIDVLWLVREKPSYKEIEEKVLSADIVWVGGGNTLRMMKLWRKRDVDKALKKAYEKGIILAGISAGSICWFSYGHSDSVKFSNPNRWNFIRVRGLGFIPAIHCPHYHAEKREKDFEKMIAKYDGVGIAIDNNAALEIVDDTYRIIISKEEAKAYKLHKVNGKVITEELQPTKEFSPLKNLLSL